MLRAPHEIHRTFKQYPVKFVKLTRSFMLRAPADVSMTLDSWMSSSRPTTAMASCRGAAPVFLGGATGTADGGGQPTGEGRASKHPCRSSTLFIRLPMFVLDQTNFQKLNSVVSSLGSPSRDQMSGLSGASTYVLAA